MAAGESCPEDGWGAKRKKQGTGKAQRSGQVSGKGWGDVGSWGPKTRER